MGDAEDLAALSELAQAGTHRPCGVPPDPRIDLVEYKRRLVCGWVHAGAPPPAPVEHGAVGCGDAGEHHARELAPGGDLAQRRGGDAGVGSDPELDRIGARATRLALGELDLEGGIRHLQRGELLAHGEREPRSRRPPGATQEANLRAELAAGFAQQLFGPGQRDLGTGELLAALAGGRRVLEHRPDAPAVLALQALDGGETLFEQI